MWGSWGRRRLGNGQDRYSQVFARARGTAQACLRASDTNDRLIHHERWMQPIFVQLVQCSTGTRVSETALVPRRLPPTPRSHLRALAPATYHTAPIHSHTHPAL